MSQLIVTKPIQAVKVTSTALKFQLFIFGLLYLVKVYLHYTRLESQKKIQKHFF